MEHLKDIFCEHLVVRGITVFAIVRETVMMKVALFAAGLLAATTVPGVASAQVDPSCVRSNQNSNTTGTVLGAAGGALAGSALAGKHSRGLGAVLGGVGGAVIGNRLANSRNDACPDGYYRDPNYRPGYAPQSEYRPQPAYGAAQPAYEQQPVGYGYGRAFWQGAPQGAWERVQWLEQRIQRGRGDGSLNRQEARNAERELNRTRAYVRHARQRYGDLRPQDVNYVQARLDYVSQRIRWARHNEN